MVNGGQDHTQKALAVLLKSSPSTVVKKIEEDAGFRLFREMEVYQTVQLKLLLHLPMNMYKRMQKLLSNFEIAKKIYQVIVVFTWSRKKVVPRITKEAFSTEKIYLNCLGESQSLFQHFFCEGPNSVYPIHIGGP